MAGGGQVAAQGLDGRRLAGAGDAGDTDPLGLAGVRHQLFQQRPGGGLMIGPPAFDQVMARARAARSRARRSRPRAAMSGMRLTGRF